VANLHPPGAIRLGSVRLGYVMFPELGFFLSYFVLFLGAGVAGFVSVRWYVRKHGYCVCEPCLVSVSGCFHLF
jgi:hypothetical protein